MIVRTALVFLLLGWNWLSPTFESSPSPQGAQRFYAVPKWRCTFTMTAKASHTDEFVGADGKKLTMRVEVEQGYTMEGVLDVRNPEPAVLSSPLAWSGTVRGTVRCNEEEVNALPGLTTTKTRVGSGNASDENLSALQVDAAAGTYTIALPSPVLQVTETATTAGIGGNNRETSQVEFSPLTTFLPEQALPASGLTLSGTWEGEMGRIGFAGRSMTPIVGRITWSFVPDGQERPRLRLADIPADYLPTDGNTVETTLTWDGSTLPEDLEISLRTSNEDGVCLNSVSDTNEADFTMELLPAGFPQWIPAEAAGADSNAPRQVFRLPVGTRFPIRIRLKSRDFGGWAVVSAKARWMGNEVVAQTPGGRVDLTVPMDMDGDHIADRWERQHNAVPLAPTWDQDIKPLGSNVRGDSITVYEEYRGFHVKEGGRVVHRRMKPDVRELFVTDPAGIVNAGDWRLATQGLEVHVLPAAAADRVATKNAGYAHVMPKYAVPVKQVSDASTGDVGWTEPPPPRPPKYTQEIVINKKAIEVSVETFCRVFRNAAANPNYRLRDLQSGRQVYLGRYLRSLGQPRSLIEACARETEKAAFRQRMIEHQLRATVVHELGHACAIEHHGGNNATVEQMCGGVSSCPTRYYRAQEWMKVILQEFQTRSGPFPPGMKHFCATCQKLLNVNDR